MKKDYRNLSQEEKFILVIDKFINNMKSNDFCDVDISYYCYMFCAGYHVKHYSYPSVRTVNHGALGVVDMIYEILSFFDSDIGLRLSNKKNMLFFLNEVVDLISCNKEYTELRYLEIKAAYEKSLLRTSARPRRTASARSTRL
ncbi:hypothetical protein [Dickeya fangzhongdai]|uniref:hypothetical protein n=1 Tax=Dickeya fangzhongdai TaxID=1778540 RepID=UPI0026DF315E|nr:hypothetical protein [Dickeya fangzhongdai]WKV52165.1 hypothetical protein PL145_08105 [Dickeya fangzhongdai]